MLFGNSILELIALVAAIWVIYDVWTKLKAKDLEKIAWTVAAILFNVVTAIVYYFVKKK